MSVQGTGPELVDPDPLQLPGLRAKSPLLQAVDCGSRHSAGRLTGSGLTRSTWKLVESLASNSSGHQQKTAASNRQHLRENR
jgi:hypothetical protein